MERIEIPIKISMQEDSFDITLQSDGEMNAGFGDVTKVSTEDYNKLYNQPSINDVVLKGNKTLEELGDSPLTNIEIKQIFDRVFGG